jgi:hypothetical protein
VIVLILGGPAAGVAGVAWMFVRARAKVQHRAGWMLRVSGGSPTGLVDYRREDRRVSR